MYVCCQLVAQLLVIDVNTHIYHFLSITEAININNQPTAIFYLFFLSYSFAPYISDVSQILLEG